MINTTLITEEEKQNAKKAVKALLINEEGKFLVLVQNSQDKKILDLPGGKKEGQETDKETFKREVMEEVGINVDPDNAIFAGTWAFKRASDGVIVSCNTYKYHVADPNVDIYSNPAVQENISEFFFLSTKEFLEFEDSKEYEIQIELYNLINDLKLEESE